MILITLRDIAEGWLNHTMAVCLKKHKPSSEIQQHLDKRFQICMRCPHMRERTYPASERKWRSCGKCKCSFPALIFAYKKKCPVGKWDAIEGLD